MLRLRALYTVEASYIVPLFTIIVVLFIHMMLLLHDKAVFNCVQVKMNVRAEFENLSEESYRNIAKLYLSQKLILDMNKKVMLSGIIVKNNMPQYARISKAVVGVKEEEDD